MLFHAPQQWQALVPTTSFMVFLSMPARAGDTIQSIKARMIKHPSNTMIPPTIKMADAIAGVMIFLSDLILPVSARLAYAYGQALFPRLAASSYRNLALSARSGFWYVFSVTTRRICGFAGTLNGLVWPALRYSRHLPFQVP